MKFNLKTDVKKAHDYLAKLVDKRYIIEIKRVCKLRTNQQNRYLHKLFQIYGATQGLTVFETKCFIKFQLKYYQQKDGYLLFDQTSQMDTKQMTIFIERFRNYASGDVYLPSADEYNSHFDYYENYIEQNIEYL